MRPRPRKLNRATGAMVYRTLALEVMKHVLGAVGGPDRQAVMIDVFQGPTAANGDQPGIANLAEDHGESTTKTPNQ